MADAVSRSIARVLAANTHYATLGITQQASEKEMKAAYRLLSLSLHPDKCSQKDGAAAFQKVNEAHGVLSDTLRRRGYDMELQQLVQQQQRQSHSSNAASMHHDRATGVHHDRASTNQSAPWAPTPMQPAKPVWESAEVIAERKLHAAEYDRRALERELAEVRQDLHSERRAEKERTRKHDLELTVQKRLAAEARAEREKMRAQFELRLNDERQRNLREREEDAARIAHLQAEVAAARAEAEVLRRRYEPGGDGPRSAREAGPRDTSPPATTRVIERDAHGNYVVVERDAKSGAYTVSRERVEASLAGAQAGASVGRSPVAAALDISAGADETRMTDALRELLLRLDLDRFIPRFEEEEIYDLALLRSFGPELFAPNMREIGMDDEMVARLTAALRLS